ncbi:phage tail protein [Modicisalibacter luteus]|uniref:Phage tail protein n=1 Tax=Modicisalibacter luteus TaxID=453962 RepID=A0ABV7M381_9GAMM|nr:phage tail protein [Halomonas lutea]GHA85421.1 hypothetical protein GCM10007159_03160 [Halomonas lutea]
MAQIDTQSLHIRIDRSGVRRVQSDLAHIRNGYEQAMARAINHTLTVTRTEAGQAIRKQVKLKAGYVRERLKVSKATRSKPTGSLATPSRGVLLTRYAHRQYANGDIGVKVKPTGGYKRMPGAFFIGPLKHSGATAIAFRNQYGPGLGRTEGLRITYGPSVSQVFTDVKDDLHALGGNRLMQRLQHEAERLLAR